MPFISDNNITPDDFRQRVNLTAKCWSCLNNDRIVFSDTSKPFSLSGLMNKIIEVFPETANSAISRRLDEYERSIRELYKDKIKRNADLVDVLVSIKREELLSMPYIKMEKGVAQNIRINKQAFEYIKNCSEDIYYNNYLGGYLHALFEEYTLLPSGEREKIIYAEKKEIIEDALIMKNALMIRTRGKDYTIIPYKLINSSANGHCYLVGLPIDEKQEINPKPFRFTRLDIVKRLKDKAYTIDKRTKKIIDEMIIERDPAFLIGEMYDVKVRLSEQGLELLSVISNHRPKCTETICNPDGTYDKTFRCTEYQARIYFIAFGAEATILSPQKLLIELKKIYEKAANKYK